jgi:hypothetical protein
MKNALLRRLSQPLMFVTLALDGYTNVNNDKVTNIIVYTAAVA